MTAAAGVPQQSRVVRAMLSLLRMGIASAELWLASVWFAGRAAPSALLAVHFGIVSAFIAVAWRTRGRGDTGLWVDAALLFLTGPLGAISMIWQRGPARSATGGAVPTAALMARNYTGEGRTSPADVLHAKILAGRRARYNPENRLSLMDRVAGGDLASQQFAISVLSLKYQPEMHPVLMAALQSPTPAVRVQAAAVFAKLRERFGAEAKRLLQPVATEPGDKEDPADLREQAAACRTLARSPFMDASVAAALLIRARDLDETLAEDASEPGGGAQPADPVETAGRDAMVRDAAPPPAARIVGLLGSRRAGREGIA